jgi:hypothetical protein
LSSLYCHDLTPSLFFFCSAFKRKLSNSVWGKRSENESDELYQRILQELYRNARRNQLAHARYLTENDGKLILVQYHNL